MQYIEVKIYTAPEEIDPLTCILMDLGIAGFAVEDARDIYDLMDKKNTYDWDYIDESLMQPENIKPNVTFYLEATEKGRKTLAGIREELRSDGRIELVWKTVDDSEWKDNWKEYFKPARITDRIVVKPTWEEYEPAAGELVIEIDPGMAFGTGAHPTTSLCVKLLEKYITPGEDTVLDVGCGSGILSVASALLGAKEVTAVDIDPVAVEVTNENVELNRLAGKITVSEGDLTKGLSIKADIVAANLMADLVMMLSKDIGAHLKGKSVYISSGILIEKKDQVAAAIKECGFRILDVLEDGEWCAIAAQL
ncbi:MAG TPA: 50S ribosomal protein L11 methyltransferase [Anaerovoracaceae bacterium]|nr:50S ribosomal protein L11 methyltransferase [Anaerovoracaceae bacterium]